MTELQSNVIAAFDTRAGKRQLKKVAKKRDPPTRWRSLQRKMASANTYVMSNFGGDFDRAVAAEGPQPSQVMLDKHDNLLAVVKALQANPTAKPRKCVEQGSLYDARRYVREYFGGDVAAAVAAQPVISHIQAKQQRHFKQMMTILRTAGEFGSH